MTASKNRPRYDSRGDRIDTVVEHTPGMLDGKPLTVAHIFTIGDNTVDSVIPSDHR